MTKSRSGQDVASWLVSKTSGFLDSRFSRRSFIARTTLVGTAVAASGSAVLTRPGAAYTFVANCPGGSLCRDGYTEFCCVINRGVNACPPNTAAAGWWRADYSVYCNGTRYYIDCNNWSGAGPCRCADGCGTRKVYCNQFRYGQCNQHIPGTGVIACRMVVCVPPYQLNLGCSPSGAVDNATANHNANCALYEVKPPPPVPAEVSLGAAVSPNPGDLLVAVRGSQGGVHTLTGTAGVFSAWSGLGGVVTSRVAGAVTGPGATVLVVRGTDNGVWVNRFESGSWSGFSSLGGVVTSDPAVVWDGSRVWVVVRGTDNGVWVNRFESGSWSGFSSLGGVVTSDPAVVWDGSRVWVVVRGTDNGVWVNRFESGSWSGFSSLGGVVASDPAVVWDGSRVWVFVRGSDNALHANRFESGSWSGFSSLGGVVTSDPAVVWDGSRVWVVVRGTDNGVWVNRFESGSWSGFSGLGGVVTSDPAVVWDGSRVWVFVRGSDNALHANRFESGSWSGFSSLGGVLASVRGLS